MLELVVAQALVEHGMLDSLAAGVTRLRYQLDAYVGEGRSVYVLVAAVVLLFLLIGRRPR